VVNYECPEDDMAYLHRIGRTGRAGRTGVAVTFVDWRDLQRWKIIDETLGLGHPEPTETYLHVRASVRRAEHSADRQGVLPRAQRDRLGLDAEDLEDISETGRIRSQAAAAAARRHRRQRPRPGRRGQRIRRRTRSGAMVRGPPEAARQARAARTARPARALRPTRTASQARQARARGGAAAAGASPASLVATPSKLSADPHLWDDLCHAMPGRVPAREHTKDSRPA
jgi:superfamily II DNA/RNA helicase